MRRGELFEEGENTVRVSFSDREANEIKRNRFYSEPEQYENDLEEFLFCERVNALDNMRLHKSQNPWVLNKRSPEHI